MQLTEAQANKVFDIIIESGNYNRDGFTYTEYQRELFVEQATEDITEYNYSTRYGSSVKVSFQDGRVSATARTINRYREDGFLEILNADLEAFSKSEDFQVLAQN